MFILKLQEARKKKNISQKQLSKIIGWEQSYISNLEHQKNMRVSTIVRFAKAIDAPIEELIIIE